MMSEAFDILMIEMEGRGKLLEGMAKKVHDMIWHGGFTSRGDIATIASLVVANSIGDDYANPDTSLFVDGVAELILHFASLPPIIEATQ
jgi:hypothetical protein